MEGRRRAFAFPNQRNVNADEIRPAQRLFKRDVLDPGLLLLNAARMAQVHRLLNALDELVVLVRRVVAQDVHVESGALLDHRQADAPSPDDRKRLSGDLVPEEGKIRMPESPVVLAR